MESILKFLMILVLGSILGFVFMKTQHVNVVNQKVRSLQNREATVQSEKGRLQALERQLASDEQRLLNLKQQMDSYRASGNISAHNRTLEELNHVQSVYDAHYREYRSEIEAHNRKVAQLKRESTK